MGEGWNHVPPGFEREFRKCWECEERVCDGDAGSWHGHSIPFGHGRREQLPTWPVLHCASLAAVETRRQCFHRLHFARWSELDSYRITDRLDGQSRRGRSGGYFAQ